MTNYMGREYLCQLRNCTHPCGDKDQFLTGPNNIPKWQKEVRFSRLQFNQNHCTVSKFQDLDDQTITSTAMPKTNEMNMLCRLFYCSLEPIDSREK